MHQHICPLVFWAGGNGIFGLSSDYYANLEYYFGLLEAFSPDVTPYDNGQIKETVARALPASWLLPAVERCKTECLEHDGAYLRPPCLSLGCTPRVQLQYFDQVLGGVWLLSVTAGRQVHSSLDTLSSYSSSSYGCFACLQLQTSEEQAKNICRMYVSRSFSTWYRHPVGGASISPPPTLGNKRRLRKPAILLDLHEQASAFLERHRT